jgi:ATP-dependent Clp protease adaptor protein ClpS
MVDHKRLISEHAPRMGKEDDDGGAGRPGTGVVTRTKPPMEFVVYVLERFFSKAREEATQIMLHVHQRGVGICGVYSYEVAETKVTQVMDFARQNQHPLQCTLEKD